MRLEARDEALRLERPRALQRRATPGKVASAGAASSRPTPASRQAASAASAFSTLCSPGVGRSTVATGFPLRASSKRVPDGVDSIALACTSASGPRPNRNTRLPGGGSSAASSHNTATPFVERRSRKEPNAARTSASDPYVA